MKISSDDLKLIEQFHSILNRGFYADSKSVTDLFNKLLRVPQGLQPVNPTNCATCIRRRILDLVNFASKIKEESNNENEKKSREPKCI